MSASRQVRRLHSTVPIAVIALDFDPVLRLGDVTIRWQTVALAATIFVALCLAAGVARRTAMRPDDLLFVVVGIVPGAVIGGRIGAVLAHADFYRAAWAPSSTRAREPSACHWPWPAERPAVPSSPASSAHPFAPGSTLRRCRCCSGSRSGSSRWCSRRPARASRPSSPGPPPTSDPDRGAARARDPVASVAGLRGDRCPGRARAHRHRVFLRRLPRAHWPGGPRGVAIWAFGRAIVGMVWRDADVIGPFGVEQVLTLAVGTVFLALALVPAEPVRPDVPAGDATGRPRMAGSETRPPFDDGVSSGSDDTCEDAATGGVAGEDRP